MRRTLILDLYATAQAWGRGLLSLLLWAWAFAVASVLGAFVTGVWLGLIERFFNIGLAWVAVYEQPICRAWLTT